jgi:cell division septation protein DedD
VSFERRGKRTLIGSLVISTVIAISMTTPVLAFNPGENGHPTAGPNTDLQGRAGDVDLAFISDTASIDCDGDTVTELHMFLAYSVNGDPLPAGSSVVVYLSPNDGAINNNADSDNDGDVSGAEEAAYVAAVESNYVAVDVSGLSDMDTLDIDVTVTEAFKASNGGILGVIASDLNGSDATVEFTSKTNSLQCDDAAETPTPTPTGSPDATPTATPTAMPTATPTATPTGTPDGTPTPTPAATPTATPDAVPTPPDTAIGSPVDTSTNNAAAGAVLVMLVAGSLAAAFLLVRPLRRREDRGGA